MFVKELDKDRCMLALQLLGVNFKGYKGDVDRVRLYTNAFFPSSFRGVTTLEQGDLVRISGRITSIEQIEDPKGQNTTVIRQSIHGYSVNKQYTAKPQRPDVASELGVT